MNIRRQIQENFPPLKGHYKFTLENVETGEIEVLEYDNVITRDAWELIANNFGSSAPANSMPINKAALGTGTTAPADTDHDLQAEVYRNNLFSKSNAANVVYATAFFNQTEVNGTFREAGIFSNGTAAANSGVLISHVAINVTKTASHTLTIDFTLTIGT